MRRRTGTRAWLAAGLALAVVAAGCRVDDPSDGDLYAAVADVPLAPHTVWRDVAYGPEPHQLLDVYSPKKRTGGRTIVWFHGGGWESGSKNEVPANVPFLLSLMNQRWTVVVVDYRLVTPGPDHGLVSTDPVPADSLPAALADARAAVDWLGRNAKFLGLNPRRIVVGGESAGGTLAALLGTTGTGSRTGVRGWVALDAPMDLERLAASTTPYLADLTASRAVAALLGCRLLPETSQADCPTELLRANSPLVALDAADPPGFLVAGAWDDLVPAVDHALPMEAAAEAAGAFVALDLVDTGDGASFQHNATQRGMNYVALVAWLGAVSG